VVHEAIDEGAGGRRVREDDRPLTKSESTQ
jgi:hypothetical protein